MVVGRSVARRRAPRPALGAALGVAVAVAAAGCVREPTAYEAELARIAVSIEVLEHDLFAGPIDLQKVTRHAYLVYRRAALSGEPSDWDAARTTIDAAMAKVGPLKDLIYLRANLELSQHRPAESRRELAKLTAPREQTATRYLLADIAMQEGDFAAARGGYEQAIAEQRTWDRLARLASLQGRTGDVEGADALYAAAQDELTAKEMRSYAWVELQRGLLDLQCGRPAEALAHYEHARLVYSGYWLVEEHLAELLAALDRHDEALALYERVLASAPRPEFHEAVGALHEAAGDVDAARACFDRALSGYLASAERGEVRYLHHLTGFYSDVRRDGDEAVKWAQKDFELRPGVDTRSALAWALYRAGRFEQAAATIEAVLQSGLQVGHVFLRAAEILGAAGRAEESDRLRARALALNPNVETFPLSH